MVVQVQLPRELIVVAPMRVAARPGVTSYNVTVPPVAVPEYLHVPAKVMSFLNRCLAVVMVTTSVWVAGCVVTGAADWVGAVVTGAAVSVVTGAAD